MVKKFFASKHCPKTELFNSFTSATMRDSLQEEMNDLVREADIGSTYDVYEVIFKKIQTVSVIKGIKTISKGEK